MTIFDYIIIAILVVLGLISFITDIKRKEIEPIYCLIAGIAIILLLIFGTTHRQICSPRLQYIDLTITRAIICAIIIFVLFLILPIGGGDMYFLTAISLYLGVAETLYVYCIANIIVLAFAIIKAIIFIRENKQKFIEAKGIKKIKALFDKEYPLMIGLFPALLLFLTCMIISSI